jgi:hypothetical protein
MDGAKLFVESKDGTELDPSQSQVIRLLFDDDVTEVRLKKLGKGFSSALKLFCSPTIEKAGTTTTGSMTFIKLGDEEEVEEELRVTQHMMQILGVNCPQVLGYSELSGKAVLHLSLVNLSLSAPRGFADLYAELLSPTQVIAGTEQGEKLLGRILSCIDFTFSQLTAKLHESIGKKAFSFSVADELGLCKDCTGGKTGLEKQLHMSSSWVLEKLWRKKPGNGGLASSVRIHISEILGPAAEKKKMLKFHEGHPCELPNICISFLDKNEEITKVRDASLFEITQCFVHGDLHGDNIMIDGNDNRFLIDFGKTSLGHSLEDVTWLETFILLSYTDYATDEEFADALHMLPALAPPKGFTLESCDGHALESALTGNPRSARMTTMWSVVKSMRNQLAQAISRLVKSSSSNNKKQCCLIATLLLLRNALFFLGARENQTAKRRRSLALAMACAYAQGLQALV